MQIFLIRHGETIENTQKIIQGQSVGGELSNRGKIQMKEIANLIKYSLATVIYSSDVKRSLDSAEIISKELGLINVVPMRELRERNWGEFEGKTEKELNWNEIKLDYYNGAVNPPKGESLKEFQDRVASFLELLKFKREESIILVTHKNFIKELILLLQSDSKTVTPLLDSKWNYQFEL
jgi:broad specificity phosphatase PhoE